MEFNLDTWRAERARERRADDDKIDQLCDIALNAQIRVKELEALTEELKKALKSPADNVVPFTPAEQVSPNP